MKKKSAIVALTLCLVLAISGCSGKTEEAVAQKDLVPIEVLPVTKGLIKNDYLYSGTIKPTQELNIFSTVNGKVAKVYYEVGDMVDENAVLFEMDTTDIYNNLKVLNASLASANAGVESARTNLEYVNGASMQTQIENSRAAVDNAKIAFDNAKTTYENNLVLFENDIISKTTMEQIENAYKQAEIGYNQAQETYNLVAVQMIEENTQKANDGLKLAQASRSSVLAQIESAKKMLNDAVIKSPITGIVAECNVKEGVLLPQTSHFTIINMDKVNINVSVSEQIINSLKPGQYVDVRVSSVSSEMFVGEIKTVSPAAGYTGTYDVEIQLNNEDGLLKSGMFTEVYFVKEMQDDTIVIPRNAVITKGAESYVFIEENGMAKKVVVTVGLDSGNEIEILSGLKLTDKLVVKGQEFLDDGDKVEITSTQKGE